MKNDFQFIWCPQSNILSERYKDKHKIRSRAKKIEKKTIFILAGSGAFVRKIIIIDLWAKYVLSAFDIFWANLNLFDVEAATRATYLANFLV